MNYIKIILLTIICLMITACGKSDKENTVKEKIVKEKTTKEKLIGSWRGDNLGPRGEDVFLTFKS